MSNEKDIRPKLSKPGLSQKPSFKKHDGRQDKLTRKNFPGRSGAASYAKRRPDDIPFEEAEERFLAVNAQLETDPKNEALHKERYHILRALGDKELSKKLLAESARVCESTFFAQKLSDIYEEEGRYSKALEWRQWCLQFQPDDPDFVRRVAVTAMRAKRFSVAEKYYNSLIDLRRNEESPLGGTFYQEVQGKGLTQAERQETQEMGLRLVAHALTHQGSNPSLLEVAARLSYSNQLYEEARMFYERAIAENSHHKNIFLWKLALLNVYADCGLAHHWHELSQNLMRELEEHLKSHRTDTRAWLMLAKHQIVAGYFQDALNNLKECLYTDSRNSQALWELGQLYIRMGQSDEAIKFFRSITQDPNEKRSVKRIIEASLADLYVRTGHYFEALDIYMMEPEHNLTKIAPIYEILEEAEEADFIYRLSVKYLPRDARSHLGYANHLVRSEQWDEAIAAANEGLSCNYATEEVHSELAIAKASAQMNQNQMEEALETVEEICKAYPESVFQQFRKVKLLLKLGRKEEAIELAKKVKEQTTRRTACAPASSSLYSLLGDCQSLLGQYNEAFESYTNALKYDYMEPVAVRGLGIILERRGDYINAGKVYKRFVTLEPLDLATPHIKKAIEKIEANYGPLEPKNSESQIEESGYLGASTNNRKLPSFIAMFEEQGKGKIEESPPTETPSDWMGSEDDIYDLFQYE